MEALSIMFGYYCCARSPSLGDYYSDEIKIYVFFLFFFSHSSNLAEISLSAITFKLYVLLAGCEAGAGACSEYRHSQVS